MCPMVADPPPPARRCSLALQQTSPADTLGPENAGWASWLRLLHILWGGGGGGLKVFTSTQEKSWKLGNSSIRYSGSLLDRAQGADPAHVPLPLAHTAAVPKVQAKQRSPCLAIMTVTPGIPPAGNHYLHVPETTPCLDKAVHA